MTACGAPKLDLNQSGVMVSLFAALVVQFRNAFADRRDVLLENAALRQQLAIYQRTGKRAPLTSADRLFWVWLCRIWHAGARPSSSSNQKPSSVRKSATFASAFGARIVGRMVSLERNHVHAQGPRATRRVGRCDTQFFCALSSSARRASNVRLARIQSRYSAFGGAILGCPASRMGERPRDRALWGPAPGTPRRNRRFCRAEARGSQTGDERVLGREIPTPIAAISKAPPRTFRHCRCWTESKASVLDITRRWQTPVESVVADLHG
jgi:hypothetical protein